MSRTSNRRRGREFQAGLWLARHPGSVLGPGAVTASGVELGWTATGGVAGAAALGLAGWYRAHPDTFDRHVGPYLRAWRRRWVRYVGARWNNVLRACELASTNRKTGEELLPRLLRVRSASPHVETLFVKLVKGQHLRHFEAKLPELTEALKAERVAVERVKPMVIALIVQRSEPFTEVIDAPEMPEETEAVSFTDIYVGEDEYGDEFRLGPLGQHVFVAGATGVGKNSIPASLLRGMAPALRDGLVRLWICDPKQMEFAALAPIAHRYATATDACTELVGEYVADMQATQRELSSQGTRKITVSRETPLNVLIADEMGALLAYGDGASARELKKSLALVGSQGRATGHSMLGLVQEPTKDTVPVRELFTVRVCLRVTSASHVDMTLGDGARLRGALADEIPNTPDTAGVGYAVRQRTRTPLRIRSAYVSDDEITELVNFVNTPPNHGGGHLRAVS
ncbi:cell division protein FtsK [Saccharomonospora piscinae]|uniref:FtsK/SpoIIIE domain-containing protein n=1 Tax=Saccharomonospora piscinae TaxID=687388 RepID=UPI001105B61A|nr:FtsK/SpoIIIE domain-containing protein [Saccharomonospora piscinae]TLW92096.1 cell division protein FtsK [Saccharomonospora piscinae]